MSTVTMQTVRLVLAAALARSVPPGRLLAAIGLAPEDVLPPDGRVPATLPLRLWQLATELSGDPDFGLAAAEHLQLGYFGALSYAIHSSTTVRDGLKRLISFFRLVHQQLALELVEDQHAVRVRLVTRDHELADKVHPADVRNPLECLLASLLLAERRATGVDFVPLAVCFPHPAPASTAAHTRIFGVEPAFDQPAAELILPRDLLDLPHRGADVRMASNLDRHLQQVLRELPPQETFLVRVRGALTEELRHGEPTVPRLAERLRMSRRTLQRRLQQEGTSLQELLDDLRRDLALRYLRESRESIAEIAFVLGFSEVSAFHRAFKRWTGTTPSAHRQQLAASTSRGSP